MRKMSKEEFWEILSRQERSGWEYDNGVKEDWAEDVTGEYIFFEDVNGKSVTITKLTSTELHITATDKVSEENYQMQRR